MFDVPQNEAFDLDTPDDYDRPVGAYEASLECHISYGCLPLIGYGHVMRCLTLADALTDQGSIAEFVCREHEGNLIDLIASRGFKVHVLSNSVEIEEHQCDLVHAKWLGAH